MKTDLDIHLPHGTDSVPIGKTERFSMFKVAHVLSVNHGMGSAFTLRLVFAAECMLLRRH